MDNFSIAFENLMSDKYLRVDQKYHKITDKDNFNIFHDKGGKRIHLSEVIQENYELFQYEEDALYRGIPTGQSYIDEDGDIIDYQTVTLEEHPGRLKYKISQDSILMSSLRLAKSPALMYDDIDFDKYVFSNGFYCFHIINGWKSKYVLYLLRTRAIKELIDNHLYRGIGISAYRAEDFLKTEVRDVPIEEQEKVVKQIEEIEETIRQLKRGIGSIQEAIDFVFQEEFSFDYDKFEKWKSCKNYEMETAKLTDNRDLRFSVKYHRPAGTFVRDELLRITDKKIKHFLAEPITLGASISPKDFDENGKAYYVSMATIKTMEVELDESQLVSQEYYANNKEKLLQKGDIVVARSGVAIGKTALVKEEFDGIFADFTMRIRLDQEKYNPLFAYYYLRSKYVQYLIEINKKGLQNQNIFPIILQDFPLPDLPLERQEKVIAKIESELSRQTAIKQEIAELRAQVEEIMLNSLGSAEEIYHDQEESP